jgi:hypothetical protein
VSTEQKNEGSTYEINEKKPLEKVEGTIDQDTLNSNDPKDHISDDKISVNDEKDKKVYLFKFIYITYNFN